MKNALAALGTLITHPVDSDVGRFTLARMAELTAYNAKMYQFFERHLGQRVLEVGSGVGNLSRFLPGREFVLLTDYDREYLDTLRHKFGCCDNVRVRYLNLDTFRAADLRPFSLDSIICLNVLEHIEGDMRVLREFCGSLVPGGKVIVLVPAHPRLYSAIDRGLGHYRRYTRLELIDKLRFSGFRVDDCSYFNWIGAIGWFLFGRVLRRRHVSSGATRGFRLVSGLQSLEKYVPLPFGLSLVAIATRPEGWGPVKVS